ncbi:hypothetical protein PT974_05317 [Cladobotryum mycophilum]|uniref:Tautomerase cis-CaaD-like domain-containing protein n=1 Tax=Cladobotryum mycophilum TaxID=491253 RepID=A0ABR0SIE9_9HYPO
MPLWLVFYSPGTFADDEAKHAFAEDVCSFYTDIGLPKFYVVIEFIKQSLSETWVGAEKKDKPFIRLVVDHVANPFPEDDEIRHRGMEKIEKILKPHIADKGYDWEIHIDETDRKLWRVNGFVPPPYQSEGEALWVKENRPVPY